MVSHDDSMLLPTLLFMMSGVIGGCTSDLPLLLLPTFVHVYTCACVCVHMCVLACMCVCAHACACVCVTACALCVCVCVCAHACVYVSVCARMTASVCA